MFSGNKGSSGGQGQSASSGAGSTDMFNNAMKVYKMFSGGQGTASGSSSTSGGGNVFGSIGM